MPPRASLLLFSLLLSCTVVSCGDGGNADPGGGGSGRASSTGSGFGTGSTQSGADDGCADEARWVYLLGEGRELVKFDPGTLTLTDIGQLDCPAQGGPAVPTPDPFSMAVDRSGFAWVLYSDGTLFHMDVKTAHCTATSYQPKQLTAFELFGMGFVSDQPGSQSEHLYLGAYGGDGIATLDVSTLKVERVGYYNGVSGPAEMTGTGNARLFGFFLSEPVEVAEIDKGTSKVLSETELPTIDIGDAWAFAFWGGDFWLFTSPDGPTSHVDRYRPSDGTTTRMIDDAGISIVGAGVSTCAPIVPPS